jgi:hypothetical protein
VGSSEEAGVRRAVETKRPPGQLGRPSLQGRIVPTEVQAIETFWGNLMRHSGGCQGKIEVEMPLLSILYAKDKQRWNTDKKRHFPGLGRLSRRNRTAYIKSRFIP